MKLILELATSPVWGNSDHTCVNLVVKFQGYSEAIPFTATASDPEAHGREIFARACAVEFGPIAPYAEPISTAEQIIAEFTAAIQQRLDDFARTRNYDNILSACTYATSTVPKFAAEGQYCVDARDATWATCYAILDDVQSEVRIMPTMEQVMTELPVLEWPN